MSIYGQMEAIQFSLWARVGSGSLWEPIVITLGASGSAYVNLVPAAFAGQAGSNFWATFISNQDCHIAIESNSSAPVATANDFYLPKNTEISRYVDSRIDIFISAIQDSAGGKLWVYRSNR